MKYLILLSFLMSSCTTRRSSSDCLALKGFERKSVSEFGLKSSSGHALVGPKGLIYFVVDGVVIPTVACYPAGVIQRPGASIDFTGLSALYEKCFAKIQKKIVQCPDVKKEAMELLHCSEGNSQQLKILQDPNAFSGCWDGKAIEERM